MNIVITGGAGFVGSNLARSLTERPEITQIRVIDNLSTGSKENLLGLEVRFFEGDIQNAALLDQAFHGADAIVHLAALPSVPRSVRDPWPAITPTRPAPSRSSKPPAAPAICT